MHPTKTAEETQTQGGATEVGSDGASGRSGLHDKARQTDGYDNQVQLYKPDDGGDGPIKPPPGGYRRGGGVRVSASANVHEVSGQDAEMGFGTADVLKHMTGDNSLSKAMALSESASHQRSGHPDAFSKLQNTQRATGAGAGNTEGKDGGHRVAVSIANIYYSGLPNLDPLKGDVPLAKDDQDAFLSTLGGRGYKTVGMRDRRGAEITEGFKNAATMVQWSAGDELALHYAGHGSTTGPVGVDSVSAPYSGLVSIATGLADKGVGVEVVLDACHSGAASDMVRMDLFKREAKMASVDISGDGFSRQILVKLAQKLQSAKTMFAKDVWLARRFYTMRFKKYTEHPEKRPADTQFSGAALEAELLRRYYNEIQNMYCGVQSTVNSALKAWEKAYEVQFAYVWPAPMREELDHMPERLDRALNAIAECMEGKTPRRV